MARNILTTRPADLQKIASTMVQVTEDMAEELKDRLDDLEDAYFPDLGGIVVSKVDVCNIVDAVLRDVIIIIERSAIPEEATDDVHTNSE